MKRIILAVLLLSIQSFGLVWADVTQDVQNYLNQGNKTSFRFEDNTIQTMAYLIEGEKGIEVIIDKNIDTKQSFAINLRDQNFLAYLEMTTQKLGLKYQVVDSKTIRISK
ncbi:hypothetical protein [uncultured Acinetobacter sp.]|uniref:hypothetical protein n=1 Tax=uncultured Acinetobacter sp. TaxID=165433 RepID=UPI0025E9A4D2|nr:hypothetical protein [uncultured Acinetobacter sp.]